MAATVSLRRRVRFGRFLLIASAFPLILFLDDTINGIRNTQDFWPSVIILALAVIGSAKIYYWLDDKILAKSTPAQPPLDWLAKPFILSAVWPEFPMTLDQAKLQKALEIAAMDPSYPFIIVTDDLCEITVTQSGSLWQIDLVRRGRKFREIAVSHDSKWAGTEVQANWAKAIFGKAPRHYFGRNDAEDIVRFLLGWGQQPSNLAWAKIQFAEP